MVSPARLKQKTCCKVEKCFWILRLADQLEKQQQQKTDASSFDVEVVFWNTKCNFRKYL